MGGKSTPDNSAVVNEQKQEAADEAKKEADRQARIQTGLTNIKQAFEGSPTYTTKAFDWGNFKPILNQPEADYEKLGGTSAQSGIPLYQDASLPAGYTIKKVAGSPVTGGGAAGTASASNPFAGLPATTATNKAATDPFAGFPTSGATNPNIAGAGYGAFAGFPLSGGAAGAGGSADTYQIIGPDGKVYNKGDAFNIQTPDGGTSGGFDDAFYNKYKQNVLDYYMPQVDKQYSDAKKQATYGLARSGNLLSSAANDLTADLSKQNDVNIAGVRNQADTAAGDLRSQVNTERQKATSQLYATEDPEVAANQALASVRDISLSQPNMSPLSALFNVATIGGANVLKGYQGQQNLNTFNSSLPKSKGSVIT